jgi:hypothetical protein
MLKKYYREISLGKICTTEKNPVIKFVSPRSSQFTKRLEFKFKFKHGAMLKKPEKIYRLFNLVHDPKYSN